MDAGPEIHALARTLGLRGESQDWCILNSDPARVEEFLRFCETADLTTAQQFAMGELVLASANGALVDGVAGDGFADHFERFLAGSLPGLPSQVRYWSSLRDEEEFPIATLLRRLATHA